jgi:protease-4
VPVYAVVEDVCASGGYYIAVAADKIYVDKASIIGSIGVLMDGFGFTGTMQKFGVERRLMTAGENKAMLDPFSPVNPKHRELAQLMLDQVHQQFIAVVREGRGKRLKETPETFSGLFWSGETGIKLGLADALGSSDYVAREVIKQENIVDFTNREGFADRFAKKLGASISQSFSAKSFATLR